jgi:biopolymer transport protein TolR
MAGSIQARRGSTPLRRRRQMAEINVTPFVDVMLVLLIVFMVTAPLLLAGVQVDLPESEAAGLPGQDEPLAVTVTANGEVFVQETAVDLAQLGPMLVAITGENPEARIFVRGDRNLVYGRIMEVIGTINAAGFRRVALVSEPLDAGG